MEKKTIEQRAEEVILQQPKYVTIGRRTYRVHKPTAATVIATSSEISKLPEMNLDGNNTVIVSLREAKNGTALGEILASLIVGAVSPKSSAFRRWLNGWRKKRMAVRVLNNLSLNEIYNLLVDLFAYMRVTDFFVIIAFLNEVNVTKATTTASGQ